MLEITVKPLPSGRLRLVDVDQALASLKRGDSLKVTITELGYVDRLAQAVKLASVNETRGAAANRVDIISPTAVIIQKNV